jgi:hypothetical protein
LVCDAHSNPVTTSGPGPAALLDDAVTAYLGFRKDVGDRLKAVFVAEPDLVLAHCLRGYFMMLFGQRAMVPRAQRSLEAARAAAQTIGVTPREAAHIAAFAGWVAGEWGRIRLSIFNALGGLWAGPPKLSQKGRRGDRENHASVSIARPLDLRTAASWRQ